jgi:predicted adenylyl cyclase CyaB
MPRNVEIKARVAGWDELRGRVETIADQGPFLIHQEDIFFRQAQGRLKLRRFDAGRGELIHYQRDDASGPKSSEYTLAATSNPDALVRCLSLAYGVLGRVEKERTLFLAGRTRIHLDRVAGLGDFMELEVVLDDRESNVDGAREAEGLMAKLQIPSSQLIAGAYIDLLLDQTATCLNGGRAVGKTVEESA